MKTFAKIAHWTVFGIGCYFTVMIVLGVILMATGYEAPTTP
jgi:hypothetical protein